MGDLSRLEGDLSRPEIVFFDVGDTLMRVKPSWTGVYLRVCRRYGLEVDERTLAGAFARALGEGLWDEDGPFEASPETSYQRVKVFDLRAMELAGFHGLPDEFFRSIAAEFARGASWHVFPDVHPALVALARAGIRRAVISNWVWVLPELLHEVELAEHFEAVVVSARVGYQKPQREIFQHALQLTGVSASRAIHVGDTPGADVRGALSAGIQPVLIDRYGRYLDGRYRGGIPEWPEVPVVGDLGGLLDLLGLDAREARAAAAASAGPDPFAWAAGVKAAPSAQPGEAGGLVREAGRAGSCDTGAEGASGP
jgi:putative hydrolase of the HAD superfamily